jgi:hypothetical protein
MGALLRTLRVPTRVASPRHPSRSHRRSARGPSRARLRHLFDEASLQVSSTLAEIVDWLRLGR